MVLQSTSTTSLPQTLSGGLILRRSTAADAEKLAEFNAFIHSDTDEPDLKVAEWTRDLLRGDHPTFGVDDFTIVEDPQTGKIVSAVSLISQTWTYAGIPIKVGRPELVGTDPNYRQRGFVRLQFNLIHEWSRQRGELVQAITGIPYYYRQFGYEMALNLGGGRIGASYNVPPLEKDQTEPFKIRPATTGDLGLIGRLYESGGRRSLVSASWNPALWRYELSGKSRLNVNRLELRILENPSGEAVGFLAHPPYLWRDMLALTAFELKPHTSWYDATAQVIRYIWQTGETYAKTENRTLLAFGFWLCENHPAYQIAAERLPRNRRRYAWYLRVSDLPVFLRTIAPVLEERLANSPLTGYTGDLKLGFYRSGVILKFQAGRLIEVEPWQPVTKNFGKAAYPGLTFLQLLFGYHTQDELESFFPDCFSSDELKPVLRVLFPKHPSEVWPVQ